jgi:Cdc6-like AAA superfamily ATPase
VNWCCDETEEAGQQGNFGGGNNILVGRVKTVVTSNPTAVQNEIAVTLGMGSKVMTPRNHKAALKRLAKNKDLVILVLDEVDNMISGQRGESGSKKILKSLEIHMSVLVDHHTSIILEYGVHDSNKLSVCYQGVPELSFMSA